MRYSYLRGVNQNIIWVIIGANFFVYVVANLVIQNLNPQAFFTFITWFGLSPSYFLTHPWTIITNMFVHASFWHLFGNMITLFFFGSYIIGLLGTSRFLIIYFGGGILGNILYLLLGPSIPAIGASGAVYAVAGALVVMRPNIRVLLYFIVPMPLWVVILVFFVIWSFVPGLGIAWQAHLGGLVFGLIAGYIFRRRERYPFQ